MSEPTGARRVGEREVGDTHVLALGAGLLSSKERREEEKPSRSTSF
jgi:hypothetical protein